MKRIFTLALALLTLAVSANPVDKKTAEQVAVNYYVHYAPASITDYSVSGTIENATDGITTIYTFTFTSGGFVMVAADDASIPVLGYSHSGTLDAEVYNPAAQAWIENYSREIASLATSRMDNSATRPVWDNILNKSMEREIMDVTPLVTTTWDQGCYYNALCPVEPGAGFGSCGRAWTGCVATTMSVLMKYHNFPTSGIGYHSYMHPTYGVQSADFAAATYNYAAMPNNVTTANAAVATLMYHAGVSVNMQYGADGSGAFSEDVPFALVNYFNFAPTAELKSKTDYPLMADWYTLLRTELDAARPVYYAGSSTASGGHAWICDGYRMSDNKFHFNWGWSGSYNGYFAIGSLNPGGNNFNDDNRAIIGVMPGDNPVGWIIQNSGFVSPSRGINYIHAVDENVAWAAAYDGSGTGSTINEFTRTTDGGSTWTTGQILGGTTYGIGNICGISENIAYVALYNGVGNQNNTCGIYKTSNGGTTWTQLPGALQGSTSFANNVYFWNEQEGMCHGDVKDGYFEIYTTVNGGSTWQRVPAANITNGTPLSGEGGWTSCIEVTGNTVMFGTNKGRVFISDDKGLTWRVSNANITAVANGGINVIAFKDPMNGIVAQTTAPVQVRRTSDGGDTWENITPAGAFLTNDINFVPGTENTYVSTGAATGATGISYSHDGGSTWTLFGGTGSKQFLAADFFSSTVGYAGGFNENQYNGGMYRMIGDLAAGATGPQIAVSPMEINATLQPDAQATETMTITNNGDEDLTWSIAIDPGTASWLSVAETSGTTAAGTSTEVIVTMDATGLAADTYNATLVITNNSTTATVNVPVHMIVSSGMPLDPPTDLQAAVSGNDVHLTWNAPGGGTGTIEELIYDNDLPTGGYSYNGYTMSTHMTPQGPCQVLSLKYFTTIGGVLEPTIFNAEVYGWDGTQPSTTLLHSVENINAVNESWVEVDISAANLMVTGDFVVGFGSVVDSTYLGYDEGLNNGRSWDYDNAGTWASWNEAYLIRAVVQYTDGKIRELSATPATFNPALKGALELSARTNGYTINNQLPIPARNHASRELLGYNVYRDGAMINTATVTELFYDDNDLEPGTYEYHVRALYAEGESENSNAAVAVIEGGSTTGIILDFEDLEDFSLTFGEWTAVDGDGGNTYGFEGITFPHTGEPMSYIAFNPAQTTPAVTDMEPHGGLRFGACFASVPPAVNDDWMISPKIMLGEDPALAFWVKSYTDQYGLETYNIKVSTTDMNPGSFTTIAGPIDAPADAWTFVSYDLADYIGQEVYVAIQCVSNDRFVFMIDDVEITYTTNISKPEAASFTVYPNPSNGLLNITGDSRIENIRLVNFAGQVVYESAVNANEFRFETTGIAQGLYLLNITTERGIVTRKVSIR
ncbi:protein containing Por secretion system C-terminal sorting domain [Lentimicrobium saccharophilum]|uniref:Protein containing Por secretion system C-terminal sorting domain n=1 Tax=Lentimicrobium saccharophilum TaxID=1678841 RepID=A0A0S7C3C8_9BACT|nr:C10 family peptidase [Lentimicrobium saccharophilum]GAP44308.1 protein containing Por secretion system C-terminal sorting domain [Lentimicrobium saccharophilum]